MILGIDTATRWLGVALHDGQRLVAELGWQSANTQTVELAPAIAGIFDRAHITAATLRGIGVAIGPGSYTGLRVGLGVAKGLSLAYQIPLVGVPTLDIVAANVGRQPGDLIVVAEAGRTRVCAARYRWHRSRGWQPVAEPDIYTWEALIAAAAEKTNFAGEISAAARKQMRQAAKGLRVMPAFSNTRRAGVLAHLAWNRLKKGESDDPAALTPVYLRDPAGQKMPA